MGKLLICARNRVYGELNKQSPERVHFQMIRLPYWAESGQQYMSVAECDCYGLRTRSIARDEAYSIAHLNSMCIKLN